MTTTALASTEATTKKRLSLSEVLEKLLDSRGRGGAKTGAVTIGRSARGIVTWEVTATADPDELDHLDAALDAAIAAHGRLATLYPMEADGDA